MERNLLNSFFLTLVLFSLIPEYHNLNKGPLASGLLQLRQNATVVVASPSQNSSKNSFFSAYGPCLPSNCKGPNAYCMNPTQCQCFHGYANYQEPGKPQNGAYCQYVQKSQLSAFLLELFLSSGVGHLYAGRLISGLIKLFICLLFCFIYAALKYYLHSDVKSDIFSSSDPHHTENDSTETEKYLGFLFCFLCCGIFVWQIVDLVFFGVNGYNDGNGVPLASW